MKTKIKTLLVLAITLCLPFIARAQVTPQQFDQMMANMSPQERQVIIMSYWQSAVQAIVTNNYRDVAALQRLEPVIRKYDAQYLLHDAAATQTVMSIIGPQNPRPNPMPSPRPYHMPSPMPSPSSTKLCGGFGRYSCNGTGICRYCYGTGSCQGYGATTQCTACHGTGRCKFH